MTGDFFVGVAGEEAGVRVTLTKISDNPDSVAWVIRNWGGLNLIPYNVPVFFLR